MSSLRLSLWPEQDSQLEHSRNDVYGLFDPAWAAWLALNPYYYTGSTVTSLALISITIQEYRVIACQLELLRCRAEGDIPPVYDEPVCKDNWVIYLISSINFNHKALLSETAQISSTIIRVTEEFRECRTRNWI
jgi:hypothetical protein